jgi:hypothetical protein
MTQAKKPTLKARFKAWLNTRAIKKKSSKLAEDYTMQWAFNQLDQKGKLDLLASFVVNEAVTPGAVYAALHHTQQRHTAALTARRQHEKEICEAGTKIVALKRSNSGQDGSPQGNN